MILSVEELVRTKEFADYSRDQLKISLDAVEETIRSYTQNNFQQKKVRFEASSEGQILNGSSPFLRVGDTIQISQSEVNDGLYVITEVTKDKIRVDRELFSWSYNLVTKIVYPPDVKQGVLNLLKWEITNRDKVGIKSETLSRHSVTYYDQDSNNTVMGYPVSLMGFLKPYKKARF